MKNKCAYVLSEPQLSQCASLDLNCSYQQGTTSENIGNKKKGRGVRKISACGVFLKGDGILHDELGGGFFAW